MSTLPRRRFAVWAGAVALACTWSSTSTPAGRIHVLARKFAFEPEEVRVRQGARVTLVLTSVDFTHGFALPDFGLRCDVVPGREVELTFLADKAGRFHMLCDNFCGDGHDRMNGWLVVMA